MSVLFWDMAGAAFDGNTPKKQGLGGSEMAQVQLAEGLAEQGVDVHVLVARDPNQTPRVINGVRYGHWPLDGVHTVIASRMTLVPEPLAAGHKVIVSLTDAGPHKIARCNLLVGVSRWQLSHFPGRFQGQKTKVIPPIVEHVTAEKVPGKFVYCSGRAKGLDATLEVWHNLKSHNLLPPEAHLRVTTAGWDLPAEGSVETAGATWLGVLTPEQIRKEIASAVGLFYVNVYPETFCAIAAIAEASGTRPIIACKSDPGGLVEAISTPLVKVEDMAKEVHRAMSEPFKLTPRNYSKNKVVAAWRNVLDE